MPKLRKFFGIRKSKFQKPELTSHHYQAFKSYLQLQNKDKDKKDIGLENTLKWFFPITYDNKYKIEYDTYRVIFPTSTNPEHYIYCQQTMSCKVEIDFTITAKIGTFSHTMTINEFPLMDPRGFFVINGVYKFLVGSIAKSSGPVFYKQGENIVCKIMPIAGAPCSIETSNKKVLYLKIGGKRKKMPLPILAYVAGRKSLEACFKAQSIEYRDEHLDRPFIAFCLMFGKIFKAQFTVKDKIVIKLHTERDPKNYIFVNYGAKYELNPDKTVLSLNYDDLANFIVVDQENVTAKKLIDSQEEFELCFFPKDKEYISRTVRQANEAICKKFILKQKENLGFSSFNSQEDYDEEEDAVDEIKPELRVGVQEGNSDSDDDSDDEDDLDPTKLLRPSDRDDRLARISAAKEAKEAAKRAKDQQKKQNAATVAKNFNKLVESISKIFQDHFFNNKFYNIAEIGRHRLNQELKSKATGHNVTLEDIYVCINHLLAILIGKKNPDTIDSLYIKRVKDVKEIIAHSVWTAISKLHNIIKLNINYNVMQSADIQQKIAYIFNSSSVTGELKKLFHTSSHVQFLDQTNPLAELAHMRRFTLGQNSTKFKTNLEIRDVDSSYYAMLCPIETPEGLNVGLINSITCCARINKHGFIETPLYKVNKGVITDEIVYMTTKMLWSNYVAAFDNDIKNETLPKMVMCRYEGETVMVSRDKVKYIDVSGDQITSVASSGIVFIKNNDGIRSLMGANMQRQAVPLITSEAPICGTGNENFLVRNANKNYYAPANGKIIYVDSRVIILKDEETDVHVIELTKFQKSGMRTCFNTQPTVKLGQEVKLGELIAEGPNSDEDELSLGKDRIVAIVGYDGNNFEDSIVVSERCVADDSFTSVLVTEFDINTKDLELGSEKFTRDIPHATESEKLHLDERGIVKVGTRLFKGKIIAGIIEPSKEAISHEEKLLKVLFGDKADPVKDISFKTPKNFFGTVIEVRFFDGINGCNSFTEHLDKTTKANIQALIRAFEYELNSKNITVSPEDLKIMLTSDYDAYKAKMKELSKDTGLETAFREILNKIKDEIAKSKINIKRPTDTMFNAVAKVRVAAEMPLEVGDKMSGRHGNKGVVSKILPVEDMPFLAHNGQAVDIAAGPLGMLPRMNMGLDKEHHANLISLVAGTEVKFLIDSGKTEDARALLTELFADDKEFIKAINADEHLDAFKAGKIYLECPVFNTQDTQAMTQKISSMFKYVTNGKMRLRKGTTGELMKRNVMVSFHHFLKLIHLASEKMHARSTGKYSLITQQPVPGKQRDGGFRAGEMEMWALMGFAASHVLAESLSIRSDDVAGRSEAFLRLMDGNLDDFRVFSPESKNLLFNTLKSCCINVETLTYDEALALHKNKMETKKKLLDKIDELTAQAAKTCQDSGTNIFLAMKKFYQQYPELFKV